MIRATVNAFEFFPSVEEDIDAACVAALNTAADEGARVAAVLAVPGLKGKAGMEVVPAEGTESGWSAGFRSNAVDDRTGVPIAWFHNHGTLANRVRALKQPGRRRRAAGEGSGIPALRFFDAGRREGKKRLLTELERRI